MLSTHLFALNYTPNSQEGSISIKQVSKTKGLSYKSSFVLNNDDVYLGVKVTYYKKAKLHSRGSLWTEKKCLKTGFGHTFDMVLSAMLTIEEAILKICKITIYSCMSDLLIPNGDTQCICTIFQFYSIFPKGPIISMHVYLCYIKI